MPELNHTVSDFEFKATPDRTGSLSDLKGKHVVLYFYPKDNTPGCTTEDRTLQPTIRRLKRPIR